MLKDNRERGSLSDRERLQRLNDASKAGNLLYEFERGDRLGYSDEELDLCIAETEAVLCFLERRGDGWELATNPIRAELQALKGFRIARERDTHA